MSAEEAQNYYLRSDVYFEPLIHKWYAWSHLMAPLPSAMNLTGRCMRLMESFVDNPDLHIAASSAEGLGGGSFVNCSLDRVEDVRSLIDEVNDYGIYRRVREGISELDNLLAAKRGHSLESLYQQIPSVLSGLVELVYDMNNNASYRIIESLVYASDLYNVSAQSISLGVLNRTKARPFVLSSPRLTDANHLHVDTNFSDIWLDALFSMRTRPKTMTEIQSLFGKVSSSGQLPIEELFTREAPRGREQPLPHELKITYLGHAGLMLEKEGLCILVDPVIATVGDQESQNSVSFSQLPEYIDYVCITHGHMDHACLETLIQIRHRVGKVLVPRNGAGFLADPSLKLMLQSIGFKVQDFEDMEELDLGQDNRIVAIPFLGEHADLNIRAKTAWLFGIDGKTVFAGADAASIDPTLYRRVHNIIGDIDFFFIGMECIGAPMSWLYGPLFSKPVPRDVNESRRFNGSDYASARELVDIFKPKFVYVYALGLEPWYRYFMGIDYSEDAKQLSESELLVGYCRSLGITSERLFFKQQWAVSLSESESV